MVRWREGGAHSRVRGALYTGGSHKCASHQPLVHDAASTLLRYSSHGSILLEGMGGRAGDELLDSSCAPTLTTVPATLYL